MTTQFTRKQRAECVAHSWTCLDALLCAVAQSLCSWSESLGPILYNNAQHFKEVSSCQRKHDDLKNRSEILIKPKRYVIIQWLKAQYSNFPRRVLTPSIKAAKLNKPGKAIMFKVYLNHQNALKCYLTLLCCRKQNGFKPNGFKPSVSLITHINMFSDVPV